MIGNLEASVINNVPIIMTHSTKKIGIDARFYGPGSKGLGRYTQEIVDRVIKTKNDYEYVVFLSLENFKNFKCDNKKVKKVLVKARWYSLSEQIIFPFQIWKEKLDLMHFTHFNVPILTPVKFVVTIHDLILAKFSTVRATTLSPFLYKIKNLGYKIVIWIAIKRAKKVIAVSFYTRDDILSKFKIKKEKIAMIYEGVSILFKTRCATVVGVRAVLEKYRIKPPFLLYVGNAYPHKNLENLIDVFLKIRQKNKNLNLVLVGKEDYFYNRLKEYAKEKGVPVVFAGFAPDEDLEIFFREALCYVFPSFYEGFGLPPLEAMTRGCPVLSSKESCLPEVLGEAAVFFDPYNKKDMANKIEQVMKNEKLREDLIDKGFEQYKKFSWDKAAKETLEVYQKVLE